LNKSFVPQQFPGRFCWFSLTYQPTPREHAQRKKEALAEHVEKQSRVRILEAMTNANLHRFLVVCALVSDLYGPGYNPRQLLEKNSNLALTATRYKKADRAAIGATARLELSSKGIKLRKERRVGDKQRKK